MSNTSFDPTDEFADTTIRNHQDFYIRNTFLRTMETLLGLSKPDSWQTWPGSFVILKRGVTGFEVRFNSPAPDNNYSVHVAVKGN